MKVAGIKINLCCVVAVLIGLFIGGHLLCSCAKCDNIKVGIKKKEGFENMGAPVNYRMGNGVYGSWETRKQKRGPSIPWRAQQHNTYKGTAVPLKEGQMFIGLTMNSARMLRIFGEPSTCACITYLSTTWGKSHQMWWCRYHHNTLMLSHLAQLQSRCPPIKRN